MIDKKKPHMWSIELKLYFQATRDPAKASFIITLLQEEK